MDTQAIIELYLRSAGWIKRTGGSELWSHEQVEGHKNTEEAQEITQQWEDAAFYDEGPEPEEDDDGRPDSAGYFGAAPCRGEPDAEPDCED